MGKHTLKQGGMIFFDDTQNKEAREIKLSNAVLALHFDDNDERTLS